MDKTDKLMYIFNDDAHNYPFFRLQLVVEFLYTHLSEPDQFQLKSPNLLCQRIRKPHIVPFLHKENGDAIPI